MSFACPDQLSAGRSVWGTIGAGDQMTSARLSVPAEGSCSDTGCAPSPLSAQPLGNMLGGNQAPNATTASVTTSMANSYVDQASIVPCKDGLGSWGFASKLELACQRKRQCLDKEGRGMDPCKH